MTTNSDNEKEVIRAFQLVLLVVVERLEDAKILTRGEIAERLRKIPDLMINEPAPGGGPRDRLQYRILDAFADTLDFGSADPKSWKPIVVKGGKDEQE